VASKLASGAIAVALLTINQDANADMIPPCSIPEGVLAKSPAEIPAIVTSELKNRLGEYVEPGEPFDATDVVLVGKHRRLIFVWQAGSRWVVATEQGGIAYNDPILAFELDAARSISVLVGTQTAMPETVCAIAKSFLPAEFQRP
jgi:hypothetical protein